MYVERYLTGELMKRSIPPVGMFIGGWGMRLSTITKAALTKIFLPMPIQLGDRAKIAEELQRAVFETLMEITQEEDVKILEGISCFGILEAIPFTCKAVIKIIEEGEDNYENIERKVEVLVKRKIESFQMRYSRDLVRGLEHKVVEGDFLTASYPALKEALSRIPDTERLSAFWGVWRETSLLAEPLSMLRASGIDEVHAVVADDLAGWFNAICGGNTEKPSIVGIFEKKRRDTGGALANAFNAFGKLNLDQDDPVILMSGDIWFNFFLRPAVERHMRIQEKVDKPICTVILYPILEKEAYRFGVIDAESRKVDAGLYQIKRFIEKPQPRTPEWDEKLVIGGRALINTGITIYSYGIHDEIEAIDSSYGDEKWREADVVLTKLAGEGRLYGYDVGLQQDKISKFDGASLYWADIGTIDAYIKEITNWGVNIMPLYQIIEKDVKIRDYARKMGLVW
ncbi:MAG: sugar phosphate nucleotidyltransferase [Candidatus Syntropharchaeales archaeon]